MLEEDVVCEPAVMDSEDNLFVLYTSGSTGKPKGLAHTQAGYLLYAALTHRVNTTWGVLFIRSHSVYLLSDMSHNPVFDHLQRKYQLDHSRLQAFGVIKGAFYFFNPEPYF